MSLCERQRELLRFWENLVAVIHDFLSQRQRAASSALTGEPWNLLSDYLEEAMKPIPCCDVWEEPKPLPTAMPGSCKVWANISLVV